MGFLLLFVLISCVAAQEKTHPDEILSLPGLSHDINFKQYSGYLDVAPGKFMHYWLVESQHSPTYDPLLLWLNGGPGCSSIGGLFSEIGPFKISSNGKTLVDNPYSWNNMANILVFESPTAVGFSYSEIPDTYFDDDIVAGQNYAALQSFFKKFPQFSNNEFFMAGESYSGIYIPTLALKVVKGDTHINFKGIAIGNGYLDHINNTNSIPFYAYYHGIMSTKKFLHLLETCCLNSDPRSCDFVYHKNPECAHRGFHYRQKYFHMHLNLYNIYQDCTSTFNTTSRYIVDHYHSIIRPPESRIVTPQKPHIPCINLQDLETYFNQKSVRSALQIPDTHPPWIECNIHVGVIYNKTYDSMRSHFLELLSTGNVRAMLYNGDNDMVCSFLSTEWFTDSLGLDLIEDRDKWSYENQVAGFVTYYKNLTVLTVKGAGHLVPQDKPGPAFSMITSFFQNKPLENLIE